MCQMYLKPKGFVLPAVWWASINKYNPHGLGIYNFATKTVLKTADQKEAYDYMLKHKDDDLFIHHRLSTSGNSKSLDALHGWDLGNGYTFFHNGVLSSYAGTATESDTQQFVAEWFGIPVKNVVKYLEEVETTSRFMLINNETGEMITPNCAKWNTQNIDGVEIKFSNTYAFDYSMLPEDYRPKPKANYYGSYGGYDYWYSTSNKGNMTATPAKNSSLTKLVPRVPDIKQLPTILDKLTLVDYYYMTPSVQEELLTKYYPSQTDAIHNILLELDDPLVNSNSLMPVLDVVARVHKAMDGEMRLYGVPINDSTLISMCVDTVGFYLADWNLRDFCTVDQVNELMLAVEAEVEAYLNESPDEVFSDQELADLYVESYGSDALQFALDDSMSVDVLSMIADQLPKETVQKFVADNGITL